MLYFSELTKMTYKTVEELEEAEAKKQAELDLLKKKREEKERREKEVISAYKKADEARDEANRLLSEYYRDYGDDSPSSFRTLSILPESVFDILISYEED